MRYHLFRILVFAGLWFNAFFANAQFDQERFGKNRLQHQQIDWYYFSSNNFEVYYYDRGGANAKMAIDYLESEFDRLTQLIGYVAYTKPKIYIYNSPEELLQSNIDLNKEEFSVEGQTNFSRLIAEVAYKGEVDLFKEDLIYNTSKIIIEEMLYGSSVADAFQSNLINNFPEWYVDGIALYLAKGWSREMDDYVRHYFKADQKPKILRLKEKEAALVGQSIWNYIAERYGKRYVSSVLNLSRINRNEENSIANTIGANFNTFIEDWKNYYLTINKQVTDTFEDISDENAVAKTSPKFIGAINDIKFSPDGLNLAYVINNGGKYKIQIRELSTGNERTVFAGGTVLQEQTPNFKAPVFAWKDSANLAIASFQHGFTTLRLRSIDGSTQDKIFLRNITQILSLDFNSTGKNMVLSAISNGKSDIYTLNIQGAGKRLTNDSFDELSPMFLNDSTIIYSSNKSDLPDSVMGKNLKLESLPDYYNLYMVQVGKDTVSTMQLTNSNSKNIQPRRVNSNSVVYLSDLSGINNLMRLSVGSQVANQITGFSKSIEAFDVNSRMNKIAYSVRDGRTSFLVVENFSSADRFTPSTPRVQLGQAKNLNERLAARRRLEEQNATAERVVIPEENIILNDPIQVDTSKNSSSSSSIDLKRLSFKSDRGINTDDYKFDTLFNEAVQLAESPTTNKIDLLEVFRKKELQKQVIGPRQMEPQFFISNINTRFVIDPLRGFGMGLTGRMTGLLDNHIFQGGLFTTLDFQSGGDLFFEYEYLKSRIDFRARFDRKVVRMGEGDLTFQKYVLTKLETGFSYPLNVNARLTLAPFIAKTQYLNLNPDSLILGQIPEQNQFAVNYVGGKAEFVYDRTVPIGLYSQTGFKGKIGYVHYQALNHSERSFNNLYLDLREYFKIHKNIVLAARLYAGSYFGKNPQTYMVGGMDNWLFNAFYQPPSNRPESSPIRNPSGVENSNILFADFVDLRGFDYDEIRGNNVITFSSELRIPIFSYLTRGNITSNFIRNFQLVGFYDVGSAWDDAAPWERINDQNTEVVSTEGAPFVITLNNFNNPWLQSYGAGLRTVLLNYYMKFDMARPIRNYEREDLKFYVTLGINF